MSIRIATEKDAYEWNKIVDSTSVSNFYDQFEWCSCFNGLSEMEPLPLFVEGDDGGVLGVFPLCLRKKRLVSFLDSTPYSDYGGGSFFRNKENMFSKEVLNSLVKFGTKKHCFKLTIRRALYDYAIPEDFVDKPVIVTSENCTFRISLNGDAETVFSKLKNTRRQAIKQGQTRGAVVREAENFNDLEQYYQIYLQTMHRLDSSPIPFHFFTQIWEKFRAENKLKIFLAEYNNKVIAGVLFFNYKKVIHLWGAVSLSEWLNLRPMDLLFWNIIKWGTENNFDFLDFGATSNDPSSGNYIFKKRWGGEKTVLYNYDIILQPNKWKVYNFCKTLMDIFATLKGKLIK